MAKIWLTMVAVGVVAGNLFADQTQLTEEQKIVHVLNRLGFGPRPGDVERVRQLGLDKYIAQQLHPATIKDDDNLLEVHSVDSVNLFEIVVALEED